jgi:hypothetical protein
MAAQHYSADERTYERFHLSFYPSDQLSEIVSPLYKPEFREKAAKAAIRSVAHLDLEVLPGRLHVYDPNNEGINRIKEYGFYVNQLKSDVAKRSLAIVSFLRTARSSEGDIRLHLKSYTPTRDLFLISMLPEFRINPVSPTLDLHWIIPAGDLVEGDGALAEAYEEVASNFGLRHPAAQALPEHKRFIDSKWVYVTGAALKSSSIHRA